MVVCVSVIRHILSVSRNVSCLCDVSIYGRLQQVYPRRRKWVGVIFFCVGRVGGSVCTKWFGLHVILAKKNIYSFEPFPVSMFFCIILVFVFSFLVLSF
jgi:hypothetical protein